MTPTRCDPPRTGVTSALDLDPSLLPACAAREPPGKPTGSFAVSHWRQKPRVKSARIDHVEIILARSDSEELVVVTCYPSAKTTKDTIGTATVGKQDICEFKLGMHMLLSTSQYPAISW